MILERRLLFLAVVVALVYWAPQWMPLSAQRSADRSATSQKRTDDAATITLERDVRENQRANQATTPEQREMLEELSEARAEVIRQQGDRTRIVKSKVTDKLLGQIDRGTIEKTKSFYDWSADMWNSAQVAYERYRPRAESFAWSFAIVIAGAAIVAAIIRQTHVARMIANVGLWVARVWLVVLSFVAMAIAIGTHVNPWAFVPHEFVFAPMAALLGCAIATRLVDFNYPVWDSLVRGCGAPVISMAFIFAFLSLV